MAPLNIFIGGEDFRRLREENRYYVDKTGLIEELLTPSMPLVSLITRPRRFGKTLMMSMLQEFFDINKDSRQLFEGLAVSKNAMLCEEWMNKYPTLFLTLKNVEGSNFNEALIFYRELVVSLCSANRCVLKNKNVSDEDKELLRRVMARKAEVAELANVLQVLCRALEAHYGKPVILLIDEYDVPINYAEQNGYYKEMIGFMRNLLGAALKSNPSLKFAVLTGCLRIAKESIFTGLNNFKCYGVSDALYADKFGFTGAEVDRMLNDAGLSDKKPLLKEWYDGYWFGKEREMYCPWDILQYVYDIQIDPDIKPQAYWNNTSGNAIVKTLIAQASPEIRQKVEDLIDGKAIEEKLAEDLTYDLVYQNESNIWSMMYLTGYLTKAPAQPDNDSTALVIPNKEVRKIFTDTVSEWFNASLKTRDLPVFINAAWNGDAAAMQHMMTDILYDTISYHDSKESFYHGFLTGLIRGAGMAIKSNREQGLGRTDIVIEDGRNKRALIFEIKIAGKYELLEQKADEALAQIEDRKYASGLSPHIKTACKYGIAFWEKECCVKLAK